MHHKHLFTLGLAGAIALSAGVSAKPRLTTDAAQGVNFADYKTYTWLRTHPPGGFNSVAYQRVQAHLDSRLAAKGYQHHAPADLTLVLTVGRRLKVDLDTWNRYGYHDSYSRTEGQVSLDAFDTKTKKAVWHGQVTEAINPDKPDPAKAEAALIKLMEKFPGH
jgi:hypothetical protein